MTAAPTRRLRPSSAALLLALAAAGPAPATAPATYSIKLGRAVKIGQTFAVTCRTELRQQAKVAPAGQAKDGEQKLVADLAGAVTVEAVNGLGQPTKCTIRVDKLTADGVAVFPPGTVVTADWTTGHETMAVGDKPVDDGRAAVLASTINVQPPDRKTSDDDMLGTTRRQPVGGTWAGNPDRVAEAFAADHLPVSPKHLSVTSKLTEVMPVDGSTAEVVETTVKADAFDHREVNHLTVTDGSMDGTIRVALPFDESLPAAVSDEHVTVHLKGTAPTAPGPAGQPAGTIDVEITLERTVHRTMTLVK